MLLSDVVLAGPVDFERSEAPVVEIHRIIEVSERGKSSLSILCVVVLAVGFAERKHLLAFTPFQLWESLDAPMIYSHQVLIVFGLLHLVCVGFHPFLPVFV